MKLIGTYNELITERLNFGSQERIHISQINVTSIEDATYRQKQAFKPTGFWYGFGDQWIYFVKESFSDEYWNKVKYAFKVKIDPSKILSIRTRGELEDFMNKYDRKETGKISWDLVANDYSGIEFPTYTQKDFRNLWKSGTSYDKYEWLYTWDVNSGCIWRPDGILHIKSFGERTQYKHSKGW